MCNYCNNAREARAEDLALVRNLRRLANLIEDYALGASKATPSERHTEGPLLRCAQDNGRAARFALRGLVLGDWI